MGHLLRQIGFAFKCFFVVLFAGRLPDPLPFEFLRRADGTMRHLEPRKDRAARETAAAPPPDDQVDRAVQLLALLQRDGRLVDFLFEDIAPYADDQVGAAVREVHSSCREVLQRYVTVEPVVTGEEGRTTLVQAGFDPGEVKLVGMVGGQPPFRGILRHRGWRVAGVQLPALPDGANRKVIAPAEVEIG